MATMPSCAPSTPAGFASSNTRSSNWTPSSRARPSAGREPHLARRAHEFLPQRPRRRQAVRWHVSDTDKATVCGVACKCVKADREWYILQSLVDDKVNFPFTVEAYEALLDGQEFDLEPNGLSIEKAEARLKAGISSARELRGAQQLLVDLREIAVWKFQELHADDRASKFRPTTDQTIEKEIQPYVDQEARKLSQDGLITTIKLPGAKQFLASVNNYKRLGKLALIPGWHRCGNRAQRYTNEELALVMKQAYRFLSPERPTREILYKDLKKEIAGLKTVRRLKGQKDLPVPAEAFLNQRIAKLAPFDVDAARHLDEHAKRRFHPSQC